MNSTKPIYIELNALGTSLFIEELERQCVSCEEVTQPYVQQGEIYSVVRLNPVLIDVDFARVVKVLKSVFEKYGNYTPSFTTFVEGGDNRA